MNCNWSNPIHAICTSCFHNTHEVYHHPHNHTIIQHARKSKGRRTKIIEHELYYIIHPQQHRSYNSSSNKKIKIKAMWIKQEIIWIDEIMFNTRGLHGYNIYQYPRPSSPSHIHKKLTRFFYLTLTLSSLHSHTYKIPPQNSSHGSTSFLNPHIKSTLYSLSKYTKKSIKSMHN